MKYISFLLLCFATILFCGCSNKVPLGGKITFSDDSSPLTRGIVCFEKDGFLARGPVLEDGSYQISSTGNNDGLPPGKYKVYLLDASMKTDGPNNTIISTPLVDPAFENADSTHLEFEVDGKQRIFDFQVDRFRKG